MRECHSQVRGRAGGRGECKAKGGRNGRAGWW